MPGLSEVMIGEYGFDRGLDAVRKYRKIGALTDHDVAYLRGSTRGVRTTTLDERYPADAYLAATTDYAIRAALQPLPEQPGPAPDDDVVAAAQLILTALRGDNGSRYIQVARRDGYLPRYNVIVVDLVAEVEETDAVVWFRARAVRAARRLSTSTGLPVGLDDMIQRAVSGAEPVPAA